MFKLASKTGFVWWPPESFPGLSLDFSDLFQKLVEAFLNCLLIELPQKLVFCGGLVEEGHFLINKKCVRYPDRLEINRLINSKLFSRFS